MKSLYMGVDPGQSGAIVVIDKDASCQGRIKLSETATDIAEAMMGWSPDVQICMFEKVHSMPGQGVSSTFKFGTSFGFCMGLLASSKVRYEMVTPHQWQSRMKCKTGGDKRVTKAAAQRLFPDDKITHAFADAYLLAEYARRHALGIQ
tara:strand:+ start:870 stop:1313 length:444 start_codon:yes stop_codon:yes gene_type:complete